MNNPLPFDMHVTSEMEEYRKESFWDKEPETLKWIESFKPNEGLHFLDIGANIGVYSLYCASLWRARPIIAVEPVSYNYKRLLDNIELNKFENILPMHCACGSHNGRTKLYIKSTGIGESGSQINSPVDEHGQKYIPAFTMPIELKTVESIATHLPHDVAYIKIDVDGLEMDIIYGIGKAFENVQSVLIEVNQDVTKLRGLNEFMANRGLYPDQRINDMSPHSSERRGGNPVNVVYSRPGGLNI